MSSSSRPCSSSRKRSRAPEPPPAHAPHHSPVPASPASFDVIVHGGHSYPPGLVRQWRAGALCDVCLLVGGQEFVAHKNVLAAASAYFDRSYSGAGMLMKEADGRPLVLEAMDAGVFAAVLEFCYTGECTIEEAQLTELLQGASRLQVDDLLVATTEALAQRLHPQNCLDMWDLAERLGLTALAEHAKLAAAREFESVTLRPEFHSLPFSRFVMLLGDAGLVVEAENVVFFAVITWAKSQPTKVSDDELSMLFSLIRFPVMTQDFLINTVEKEPLLIGHPSGPLILAQSFREALFFEGTPRSRSRRVSSLTYEELCGCKRVRICGEPAEVRRACTRKAPGASEEVEWHEDMDAYFWEEHQGKVHRIRNCSEELRAAELVHPTIPSEYFWFPFTVLACADA